MDMCISKYLLFPVPQAEAGYVKVGASALHSHNGNSSAMTTISNFTYDEITIGQTANYSKPVTEQDIQLFAVASGDVNPVHLDAGFAAQSRFGERIAHGMLTGGLISAALAMVLPGPGTIYMSQSLKFRLPVKIGDIIAVELTVTDKVDRRNTVTLDCKARNQHGKIVASGTAEVIAPTEKLTIARPELPSVHVT
jgi:3-hydroxybutyryl-CoA dehydratase